MDLRESTVAVFTVKSLLEYESVELCVCVCVCEVFSTL